MPSAADYERFFRQADKDGSGKLTIDELTAMMKKNGYSGSDREIKAMFHSVDMSGDGEITQQEYLEAMGVVPPEVHGSAAARKCFHEFDKNGDGTVSKEELTQVFQELGKQFSDAEIQRMMELSDPNADGKIDYDEFVKKVFGH